jgi:hypothetical protein
MVSWLIASWLRSIESFMAQLLKRGGPVAGLREGEGDDAR